MWICLCELPSITSIIKPVCLSDKLFYIKPEQVVYKFYWCKPVCMSVMYRFYSLKQCMSAMYKFYCLKQCMTVMYKFYCFKQCMSVMYNFYCLKPVRNYVLCKSYIGHCTGVIRKCGLHINTLWRHSKLLNTKTKLLIFHSFTQANLNYCPLI